MESEKKVKNRPFSGFLLGKFVSDRQYLIKQMKQEKESSPIRSLELTVNQLLPVATNLTRYQSPALHPDTNTKLWFSWRECFVIPESADYDQTPVDFSRSLVHRYVKLMDQCLTRIRHILSNIEDH